MAAVFAVMLDTVGADTAPGTSTIISASEGVDTLGPPNLRFKTNDNHTIDAVDPIPIPAAGSKYSYWKSIYLEATTAPDTQVDNLRFWSDGGGFGTGITLNVADDTLVKTNASDAGYIEAVGTPGDTGTEIITGHSGVSAVTDVFSLTEGGTTHDPGISESGNIIDAIGETSNYICMQMTVASTASPGNLADEDLSIKYDEI